jgi:hypothetical protein
MAGMWLTDSEYAEFLRDVAAILQPRLANAPGAGRRRRMLFSVLLPAPETQAQAKAHDVAGADAGDR